MREPPQANVGVLFYLYKLSSYKKEDAGFPWYAICNFMHKFQRAMFTARSALARGHIQKRGDNEQKQAGEMP
ncbi:hypothetical protein [Desulfovibrio sp. SGI.169]|uniref:hypothetical protein n=1 Tax=Desulfovibrio sp. SGI.169 TaxID=3420561 RepID=UPI003CFD05C7